MGMQGGQQRGGPRLPMSQPRPMVGGNNNSGPRGYGNMGMKNEGPTIPPFPRAWHGQDQSGHVCY